MQTELYTDDAPRENVQPGTNDYAIDDNSIYVMPPNVVPVFDGPASVTVHNNQAGEPDYPDVEQLATAPTPGVPLNVLDEHLHRFFNAYVGEVRDVGRRIPIAGGGGYVTGTKVSGNELAGLTILETGGTDPVTVAFYDGPDNASPFLFAITALAGQAASFWPGTAGPHFDTGLYAVVIGGGAFIGNAFLARALAE